MKRRWAIALVPLYWAAVRAKNALWDRKVGVRQLSRPVVSIGSLSAGGAGKTPVVLALAELLERHGVQVDVLSRGYGRGSSTVAEVDPTGAAEDFGDEPLELARAGLRVFVGADRFLAGELAEARGEARLHLLDDGFQHRGLGRTLDIVLLTAADVQDSLLPAGDLREPLNALGRADVIVMREEESDAWAPGRLPNMERWVIRRELVLPAEMPVRPLVFCAIARPDGFVAMLQTAGVTIAGTLFFRDHHGFTQDDFEAIAARARAVGADGFCTTAKDAVRLSGEGRKLLEQVGPVRVVGLRASFVDEAAVLSRMFTILDA